MSAEETKVTKPSGYQLEKQARQHLLHAVELLSEAAVAYSDDDKLCHSYAAAFAARMTAAVIAGLV